ncbi:hypothetical protein DYBT9623_02127 [Dyadobacter sp. CECT 9623]|uniref:Uncharacterized protein n=1 Tax=Dyadobacter linearis TaxID=2823330 RepID=A0ABM8UPG6_9BACT|nr:DUF6157 family protein [Dyadobacter sp. CECT 9623]CAG5069391.1 hypothetical protein DYBT9623_02127 [Dyadobacter sp. CECT 9623]
MKEHTTNYENTLIEVAVDCPVTAAEKPPVKGDKKTVANIAFDLISKNPYKFTSDDVLFQIYAEKNDLTEAEMEGARKQYFSKGQACMRASPLPKRYGWGIHNDEKGKVAVIARESQEYEEMLNDSTLKKVKAMKSSR